MSKDTPEVGDVWKDPCGQEVYIGNLGQQKVYLNWQDVKDICTKEVSEAYEQTKRENTKLKELLKKANKFLKDYGFTFDGKDCAEAFKIHTKINQALGEDE